MFSRGDGMWKEKSGDTALTFSVRPSLPRLPLIFLSSALQSPLLLLYFYCSTVTLFGHLRLWGLDWMKRTL